MVAQTYIADAEDEADGMGKRYTLFFDRVLHFRTSRREHREKDF